MLETGVLSKGVICQVLFSIKLSFFNKRPCKGSFTNYVDRILAFFDHLPACVYIFYGMNVDKNWTF